jgi:predicted nucleic acid-binding protein
VIVVDSSVWIDFFNGVSTAEVERLDGLLGVTPVAIGDLILVEVVQGFRQETVRSASGSPLAIPDRAMAGTTAPSMLKHMERNFDRLCAVGPPGIPCPPDH